MIGSINSTMMMKTTDLCDNFSEQILVAEVKQVLGELGSGSVLVVNGGGSLECALLGDMLAGLAISRGWEGIIINGCIRDSKALKGLSLGVKALRCHPKRSKKEGKGIINVPVTFAGVEFRPGHYIYADQDGIVIAKNQL